MKPWFSLILVCWALLFLLLSLSQQAGLNHPLLVASSGQWLDGCREPASGSPTASVLRSMEFDRARAAPLESVVLDYALTAVNMGPPGQEIHGPPQSMGPLASSRSKPAAQSNHRGTFLHEIISSSDRILKNRGFATAFS